MYISLPTSRKTLSVIGMTNCWRGNGQWILTLGTQSTLRLRPASAQAHTRFLRSIHAQLRYNGSRLVATFRFW